MGTSALTNPISGQGDIFGAMGFNSGTVVDLYCCRSAGRKEVDGSRGSYKLCSLMTPLLKRLKEFLLCIVRCVICTARCCSSTCLVHGGGYWDGGYLGVMERGSSEFFRIAHSLRFI